VNPEGKLLALFSPPQTAENLAKEISTIQNYFKKQT
jgi:hypothetical protein